MFKTISSRLLLVAILCWLQPLAAVAQIAPGVLQSTAKTATITGNVIQSNGAPVSQAVVVFREAGASFTTVSDVHGGFVLIGVPYGIYHVDARASNFGVASREGIVVEGDLNVVIQYSQPAATGLKEIAHVSTHSAGIRINVTPASIASVTPSDYAFQGNTSWKGLLAQVPGVTVGGGLQGGFGNPVSAIPDAPFEPVVLSINGALPYETSTTLDGMPLQNHTFTTQPGNGLDLSVYPMAIFDTADVVRGPGANTPSIVDSIGGSFVLHPAGRVTASHSELSISNDPYGGIFYNFRSAAHFNKLSATVTYGANNSPGPFGAQNIITARYNGNKPVSINGQAVKGCGTPCAGFAPNFGSSTYQSCFCAYQDALLLGNFPIDTSWIQHSGALALSYDLSSSVQASAFYAGSSAQMNQPEWGFPVNFNPGAGYSGTIAPGPHTYTLGIGPFRDTQAASLFEEKVTAYLGSGNSVLRLAALQGNSYSKLSTAAYTPNGQYQLWGTVYFASDPTTPVQFNGTSAFVTFPPYALDQRYWTNSRDFIASYASQIGPRLSADISYSSSYYNTPSEQIFNGSSSSIPSSVSEITREWRLHAADEITEKLSLDASWYLARGVYHVQNPDNPALWNDVTFPYSAPRISAVWRPNTNVAIRGAAGGGYALPQLANLVGSNAIYNFGPYYYEYKTNLNLKPEQSFGFDVGTDIRLRRDTALSFDAYRVNLFGQFYLSTTLIGMNAGLPLYANQYNNLSQSRYEGINIDVHHEVPSGIFWRAGLALTRAYVVSVPAGFYDDPSSGPNSVNTYIIPGINFDGKFQSTVPYASGFAQIGYRWGSGSYVDIFPTYYGNNNAYFEPAFVELDAHAALAVSKTFSLLATFRNVTGIYGQNYQLVTPSMGAPGTAGSRPYALFGMPFGPRALIITGNFKT